MDEFYMILSSNVEGDGNKPHKFTTTLKSPIYFSENDKWSVSLTKILYNSANRTFLGEETIKGVMYEKRILHTNRDFILIPTGKKRLGELESDYSEYQIQITSPFFKEKEKYVSEFTISKYLSVALNTTKIKFRSLVELSNARFKIHDDLTQEPFNLYSYIGVTYKKDISVTLKPGLYTNTKDIRDMLNEICKYKLFSNDGNNLRITLRDGSWIKMSPLLSYTLGFDVEEFGTGMKKSINPPKFNHHIDSMFIYTDLVDYSPIGDESAPILQLVPFKKSKPLHQTSWNAFNEMMIPVRTRSIVQIGIEIRTSTGNYFPFLEDSSVQLVLHFKKTSNGDN